MYKTNKRKERNYRISLREAHLQLCKTCIGYSNNYKKYQCLPLNRKWTSGLGTEKRAKNYSKPKNQEYFQNAINICIRNR